MKSILAPLAFSLLLCTSCGTGESETDHAEAPLPMGNNEADYDSYKAEETPKSKHQVASANANHELKSQDQDRQSPVVRDRMIIHTGELSFETKNLSDAHKRVRAATLAVGGYLSRDESNSSGEIRRHTVEARVPAARFDDFLSAITSIAGKGITDQNIRANDVTEEYVDVEARTKSKKELEARYADLLTKANSVKDMLEIEHEMGVLREEIESMEGRMNYLKDRAGFGTLTITFSEPAEQVAAAQEPGFLSKMGDSISAGWQGILSFFIGIAGIWPVLFLAGITWFLLRKYLRKQKAGSPSI